VAIVVFFDQRVKCEYPHPSCRLKTVAMKKLILLITLLVAVSVHADVLVYKKRLTLVETGGGAITRTAISGWTVVDAQTGEVSEIDVYPGRGRFHIFQSSVSFTSVSGGIGKVYTVGSDAFQEFYEDDGINMFSTVLKGLNVPLDIYTRFYNAPRTLTLVERSIFENSSGVQFIDETSGRLTFDKFNTQDANALGLTLQDTVNALAQSLINRGFIEE
jgi:hypothetical protein